MGLIYAGFPGPKYVSLCGGVSFAQHDFHQYVLFPLLVSGSQDSPRHVYSHQKHFLGYHLLSPELNWLLPGLLELYLVDYLHQKNRYRLQVDFYLNGFRIIWIGSFYAYRFIDILILCPYFYCCHARIASNAS